MRRLVALAVFGLAFGADARDALAFHVGATFGAVPGEGGAGNIYYTGTPLERKWDCTMCHIDPPGRMSLRVTVDPPSLFETFRYEVGETYDFTVQMVWEGGATELGLQSGRSNFNSVSVAATDDAGIYAGELQGPGFYKGGKAVIAVDNQMDNDSSWQFFWFAPEEPGVGTVTLYLGAVDGNGANSDPELTRSDPLGDDVFMAQVVLQEEGGATTQIHTRSGKGAKRPGWHITVPAPASKEQPNRFPQARFHSAGAYALVIALFALAWRRRRESS